MAISKTNVGQMKIFRMAVSPSWRWRVLRAGWPMEAFHGVSISVIVPSRLVPLDFPATLGRGAAGCSARAVARQCRLDQGGGGLPPRRNHGANGYLM